MIFKKSGAKIRVLFESGGDCPRTQIPIGGNLQIESERPDDMGKTSESLAELGGNQSGYAQEISNRKFETPSNGVIGRPGGGNICFFWYTFLVLGVSFVGNATPC